MALSDFKEIIPDTIEKVTESSPVKKVSENESGARLVLSFGGMLVMFFALLYIMFRWVPAKTFNELKAQNEAERVLKDVAIRQRDSIQNITDSAIYKQAFRMGRDMFEEWKANYIIVQNANSITIKPNNK